MKSKFLLLFFALLTSVWAASAPGGNTGVALNPSNQFAFLRVNALGALMLSGAGADPGDPRPGGNIGVALDPDGHVAFLHVDADGNLITTGGNPGTVTSFSAGNLSPLFTTSVATATSTPALSFALSTQTANLVFAGPNTGSAAAPTFRALVAADLPVVPGAQGGTGVANTGKTITLAGNITTTGAFNTTIAQGGNYTVTTFGSTTIPVATQNITFSGPSAARTVTLPDANITVARTDAATKNSNGECRKMFAWLKRLLGIASERINPPVFGPFGDEETAVWAARALANELGIVAPIFNHTTGTDSMVPLIPAKRTVLLVKPCGCEDRLLGRVVTADPKDGIGVRAHRIITRYTDGSYMIRGDNNSAHDPFAVNPPNLIGEVVGIYLLS